MICSKCSEKIVDSLNNLYQITDKYTRLNRDIQKYFSIIEVPPFHNEFFTWDGMRIYTSEGKIFGQLKVSKKIDFGPHLAQFAIEGVKLKWGFIPDEWELPFY